MQTKLNKKSCQLTIATEALNITYSFEKSVSVFQSRENEVLTRREKEIIGINQ